VLLAARGGGDADTIATMAGGMIGTRDGFSSIPKGWSQMLAPSLPIDLDVLAQKVVDFRRSDRG